MIDRALLLMTISTAAFAADLPRCDKTIKAVSVAMADMPFNHMPEGTVLVEFTVDEQGAVSDQLVIESSNPRLNKVALASTAKWRFEPPQAKCRHRAPITFQVKRD